MSGSVLLYAGSVLMLGEIEEKIEESAVLPVGFWVGVCYGFDAFTNKRTVVLNGMDRNDNEG